MKHNVKHCLPFSAAIALACLCGCATLFESTVSLTEVVDVAMTTWATESVSGRTTHDVDDKVKKAHAEYRRTAGIALEALEAYRVGGGSGGEYKAALQAARAAVFSLLDILTPVLTKPTKTALEARAQKASLP